MRLRATILFCLVATYAYAGYITPAMKKKIESNHPDYQYASITTGVPWLALAAMHIRESDLQRKVRNVGGPFHLDMGGSKDEFDANIRKEEMRVAEKYLWPPETTVKDDFRFACLVAGEELARKYRYPMYKKDGSVNMPALADALWGYNGRSCYHAGKNGKPTWRKSPYVANDPLNNYYLWMRYHDRQGRVRTYIDQRPGVLALYRHLNRAFAPPEVRFPRQTGVKSGGSTPK